MPDSCAMTTHCLPDLPSPVALGSEIQASTLDDEGTAPTWFLHIASLAHGTPPPKP